MAKITRAQIEKWNGQLSGGFKLDVMHFVTWGEKQAIRDIKRGAAAQEELQGALSNRFHGGRCQGAGSDERGVRQAEQPIHHVTDWRG